MHAHVDSNFGLELCSQCSAGYCITPGRTIYVAPGMLYIDTGMCPGCNNHWSSPAQYHLFGSGECQLIHSHAALVMTPGVNRLKATHRARYYNPSTHRPGIFAGLGSTPPPTSAAIGKFSSRMAKMIYDNQVAVDAMAREFRSLWNIPTKPPKPPTPNIHLGFDLMHTCPKCTTEYAMLHSCSALGKGMMIGGTLYPDPPKDNQQGQHHTCPNCGTHYAHYHPCNKVGRIYMGTTSYKATKDSPIELCGECMDEYQNLTDIYSEYDTGNWRPIDNVFHFAWIITQYGDPYMSKIFNEPYQEEEYLCDKEPRRITHMTDADYLTETINNLGESEMRMTSTLNDAGMGSTIPKGLYNAHVIEVGDHDKNDVGKPLTSKAGAPMVDLTWMVDEGPYADKKIRYDTVMLGGNSKEGKPISLGRLCTFLHFTGVPWECADCRNGERAREFYIAQDTDDDKARGLKKGNFYCPDCKALDPRMEYDTANFQSARCGVGVNTKKQEGSDREFNTITGYTTLRTL